MREFSEVNARILQKLNLQISLYFLASKSISMFIVMIYITKP